MEQCPSDLFVSESQEEICEWLCKFIAEACRSDGQEYTPRSLYLILCGLQRHLKQVQPDKDISLFRDPVFRPLKNVCDAVFKKLHRKGIGTQTKATPVLSQDEESILRKEGVLSLDNPVGLLNVVFFYNGKNFCLRGGAEHRNLKISQLRRETTIIGDKEVSCYVYSKFSSRTNQGGLASLNQKNKIVQQYESDSGSRCHVRILDKYFEVLPYDAVKNDVFYLQPLPQVPSKPSEPWFKMTTVGKHTVGTMVKRMCDRAGISGRFTNHSLRAYGATTLFRAEVPEKLIQQRTGHRSIEALHQYERTSESQLVDVSYVMSHGTKVSTSSVLSTAKEPTKKSHGTKVSTSSVLSTAKETTKKSSQSQHCSPVSPATKDESVTFLLNNCTFSGCSITFSGQGVSQMQSTEKSIEDKDIVAETLKDINIEDQEIVDETLMDISIDDIFVD